MTVVAAIEAVALVAVVFLFLHHLRRVERDNTIERQTLADRIQRPELLPVREAPPYREPPPREDDGMSLVGKIHVSDKYEGE